MLEFEVGVLMAMEEMLDMSEEREEELRVCLGAVCCCVWAVAGGVS